MYCFFYCRLPEDFAFLVYHECAWGCQGAFIPSRYNSSRAKCIKCTGCGIFFSPNKFIFHSHCKESNKKYVQPDAANFNSWRRHMKLSGNPPEEVVYAWEDVKAMFNGGTRKRTISTTSNSNSTTSINRRNRFIVGTETSMLHQEPIFHSESSPIIMHERSLAPKLKYSFPNTHVIDYVLHQQQKISVSASKAPNLCMLSYLPWLTKKKNFIYSSKVYFHHHYL